MIGELDDIKICGMASAVPTYEDDNSKYETIIGKRQYRRQTRITGVSKRRISGRHQRSSDLCVGAAKPLLERLGWNSEEIKVLIVVTQRPNYVFPSTAFLIQKQLGLKKDCIVFDMNLGCSSFPVGVLVVSALLRLGNLYDKGLLLLADTVKQVSYPESEIALTKDIITHNMLFGSAGAAIALQKVKEAEPLRFMSKADGNSFEAIIQRFNVPASMDGGKVFDFAINDVSNDLMTFRNHFQIDEDDIDYYVFHQAQNMILNTIDDTCGIDREKELRSMEQFGNTSGVSVPLSICANQHRLTDKESVRLLCCGFGVGLSWGIVYANIDTKNILPVIETDECYEEDKTPTGPMKERTVVVYGADTPLGESLCRCLDMQSANVFMVGKDKQKLRELQNDMYYESYVYEGTSEKQEEIMKEISEAELAYPIRGVIFAQETMDNDEITKVFAQLNEEQEQDIKMVIVAEKNDFDNLQKLVGRLDEDAVSEEFCINGITYDKDKLEVIQYVREGRNWSDEFMIKGCPKEMKRQFHISFGIRFLLSNAGQFTSGTVMRMER